MRRFNLTEDVARQAHRTIAGENTVLSEGLMEARSGNGADTSEWLVPVTPATVYRLESLFRLARDENIAFNLGPATGLNDRETAFLDDFRGRCLPDRLASKHKIGQRLRIDGATLNDCVSALARVVLYAPAAVPMVNDKISSAVLIGAYGGEHVGDMAILGGVLQHLHNKYGLHKAFICSHRPDHTRRLVTGLETPVEVTVHAYEIGQVDHLLDNADALVLAGGPMMDLPRVLVKHLASVCAAQKRNRPFIIERVGIGPFRLRASQWAVRRIARHADQISVRTSMAAKHPVLAGIDAEVGRDPAFDFLAERRRPGRLPSSDRASIEEMLKDTDGRLRVAINLRPISHNWSHGGPGYARMIEDRLYERMAEGLIRFAAEAPRPVTYVFFPLNPIQFGDSDLASAYRLHRLVGGKVDFRVWEADPDMAAVLYLLEQTHMAVTMRFHAAIFALSRGTPVLGIDYRPGQGCKVEQMFHDLERHGDVCRMESFDVDWMVGRLLAFSARVSAVGDNNISVGSSD